MKISALLRRRAVNRRLDDDASSLVPPDVDHGKAVGELATDQQLRAVAV